MRHDTAIILVAFVLGILILGGCASGRSYSVNCQSQALYCAAAAGRYFSEYEIVTGYFAARPNARHSHCRVWIDGEAWWVYPHALGIQLRKDSPFDGGLDENQSIIISDIETYAKKVMFWQSQSRLANEIKKRR